MFAVAAAPPSMSCDVCLSGSSIRVQGIILCGKHFPDELRESVRHNATMVRMATANGPATATDVVDVAVPGLDAHAKVLLLNECPAVLSRGSQLRPVLGTRFCVPGA